MKLNLFHVRLYLFGGTFFINVIPHFVSGVMGRSFQSPFAKPPAVGLLSSTVNILRGFVNLIISYLLLHRFGHFDVRMGGDVAAFGLGVLQKCATG